MEYKWDINYVQTIPALIQQKVLRKILEKVFITTKCTQSKTLHTLKADVFELTENKNIEKLFSKYDLFSLDQANLAPDPSQILIIQYPFQQLSCLPSHLTEITTGQLKPFHNAIFTMFFIGFLFFSTPFNYAPQLLDVPNCMQSQAN